MKLKVLVDNNTFIDEYYLGEPAVSYYIEDEETRILFDTGYSDAFIKNAKKMNIDLEKIEKIVISHGHNDHTGGLEYLIKKIRNKNIEIIAHTHCFYKKYFENNYIGTPIDKKKIEENFKLKLENAPIEISKNVIFLGEIPNINNFEQRSAIGNYKNRNKIVEDYVIDDSAIVYKSKKGLFIITGCSHSGICNIIEYAKKICNEDKIYGVIGGFHLFECNDRLNKTIKYFKDNSLELIYPCHCVSLNAKIEMGKELNIKEVGVGLDLEI